ncbi:hypothetical protein BGZ46_006502, partial [Entomortierella lignicola]
GIIHGTAPIKTRIARSNFNSLMAGLEPGSTEEPTFDVLFSVADMDGYIEEQAHMNPDLANVFAVTRSASRTGTSTHTTTPYAKPKNNTTPNVTFQLPRSDNGPSSSRVQYSQGKTIVQPLGPKPKIVDAERLPPTIHWPDAPAAETTPELTKTPGIDIHIPPHPRKTLGTVAAKPSPTMRAIDE